jgi:anti-anti-sigma factor
MSEPQTSPVRSDVVVILTITEPQVRGDTLADHLTTEFNAVLDQTGSSKVVVDFHAVEFLASVGFRPLLTLHQRTKAAGGRVVLCGLAPVVLDVLRVTRFVDTSGANPAPFEVQPDLPSAVNSLLRGS